MNVCMCVCAWHVYPYLMWRNGCFVWEWRGSVWYVLVLTCTHKVQEDSPGGLAGLEAYFDYIISVSDVRLVSLCV